MHKFLVLISRHVWSEDFTTQFEFLTLAKNRPEAREIAVVMWPPVYVKKVAYFTGVIRLV